MIKKCSKNEARLHRHRRVRGKIEGTGCCPRLNVFRSLKHIYAQVIDDELGKTLVAASSNEKDFKFDGGNKEGAKEVGKIVAERAVKSGVNKVVFDRGGYLFHGRVKELADAARGGGLKF
ncbi:MAG: 50S ribosomal protein L18 [Oscillospiraceae bacterium]|jgi:large subunit ribosomal protein L18|nr:50S ribosomal protein L18 [Oscillospiraceae bacterium]